jgi:hypothetical protein
MSPIWDIASFSGIADFDQAAPIKLNFLSAAMADL